MRSLPISRFRCAQKCCYRVQMMSDRMKMALGRIEHALDRLEQTPATPPIVASNDVIASDLVRERAANALRSLDTLISDLKANRG